MIKELHNLLTNNSAVHNCKEMLLPLRVYILKGDNPIISCAWGHRSTCSKFFTGQIFVALQKMTYVIFSTFSISNLTAIYKRDQPFPYILFAHLFQTIHCWFFFNSTKNVNLASKVKRNSAGCFVLPLVMPNSSCQRGTKNV